MDFKKHLETAWHLTLQFIIPLIIITLTMVVASVLSFGILAPVTLAGYTYSILLMIRENREPKAQDIFSQMKLFLPLLGFSIVVFIVTLIGYFMLVLPGVAIGIAVSFVCLYMIPLMIDKNMELTDAVKESFSIVTEKKNILEHVIVLILFLGIWAIGNSVFIGWLFTQPLATIFLLLVYEETVSKTISGIQTMP